MDLLAHRRHIRRRAASRRRTRRRISRRRPIWARLFKLEVFLEYRILPLALMASAIALIYLALSW